MDEIAAYREVSQAIHRGFAFLLVNGFGWLICGIVARWWAVRNTNLLLLIQGGWSLPVALTIQSVMAPTASGPERPLFQLVMLAALTQVVALPAVFIIFRHNPPYMPAVQAAGLGAHFLPYAWLHATNVYIFLGVAVSVLPYVLMLLLKERGYSYSFIAVGVSLLVSAVLVY